VWSKLLILMGLKCGICSACDSSVDMEFVVQVAQEMHKYCKNQIAEALLEQNKMLQGIINNNKELVEINSRLVETNKLVGEECISQKKAYQELQKKNERLREFCDAATVQIRELDAKDRKCKALEYAVRLVDYCIVASAVYCGYWSWVGTGF
jgi:hypothetical protein